MSRLRHLWIFAAPFIASTALASTGGDTRLHLLGLEGRKAYFYFTTGSECGFDCNEIRSAQVVSGLLKLSPDTRIENKEDLEAEVERLRASLAQARPLKPSEYRARAPLRSTSLEPAHGTLHVDDHEGTPLLPLYELMFEVTWKGKKLTRLFHATEPRLLLRGVWEVDGGRCALVIVGVVARRFSSSYPDDVALAVCR